MLDEGLFATRKPDAMSGWTSVGDEDGSDRYSEAR